MTAAIVVRPPIPLRLAHLPVQGGLAVPIVILQLADGAYDFRSNHRKVAVGCFVDRRCGVCGRLLGRPIVFFGTRQAVERGVYGEPGMHPECAAYSQQACPIVAGHKAPTTSPTTARGPRGAKCPEPGCDCGGWVTPETGDDEHAERIAGPWYAVWAENYALAVNSARVPCGVALVAPPLRVRQLGGQPEDAPVPGFQADVRDGTP